MRPHSTPSTLGAGLRPCVLFLFNSSLYAPAPWLQRGIECVTVDYTDTDHSAHRAPPAPVEGLTRLNMDLSAPAALYTLAQALRGLGVWPALTISFTPCTDLAVSGAAHFKRKREQDPEVHERALKMALLAPALGAPYIVENPVSLLSTMWRRPNVYVHPKDFGGYLPEGDTHPEAPNLFPPRDAYNKKTGLWLGNGACAPVPRPVEAREKDFPGHRALGGKSAKTKHLRSLTPRGLAEAICVSNLHLVPMYSGKCVKVPENMGSGGDLFVDMGYLQALLSAK